MKEKSDESYFKLSPGKRILTFLANVKVTRFTSGPNAERQTFSHQSCANDYLDFP